MKLWTHSDYCFGTGTQLQFQVQTFLQRQIFVFQHGNRNTFSLNCAIPINFLIWPCLGCQRLEDRGPPPLDLSSRQASGVSHRLPPRGKVWTKKKGETYNVNSGRWKYTGRFMLKGRCFFVFRGKKGFFVFTRRYAM